MAGCEYRVLVFVALFYLSDGHGRLLDPASRVSMWREGYNNPEHDTDNEFNCGGFNYQLSKGMRCGICGDPYGRQAVAEVGGFYANGILTGSYTEGSTITVRIEITAEHQGYHEFRVCPHSDVNTEASQKCLDQHVLQLAGGGTRYQPVVRGYTDIDLVLPAGLRCSHCVFQWRYRAGNNWGICEDGRGELGCGPQEEFYGCADIEILKASTGNPPVSVTSTSTTTTTTVSPDAASPDTCVAIGPWQGNVRVDAWCQVNCHFTPPFCPITMCFCPLK